MKCSSFLVLLVILCLTFCRSAQTPDSALKGDLSLYSNPSKPNIIFIFADDWGINEWGYSSCSHTSTPFIDSLITNEGLLISHNYVSKICSASRSAFLTGRYPSKLGLQSLMLNPFYPISLTRQVSVLSQEFKSAGYSTHMIGKWHLGFQSWEYTPTYRGFDTFHGFYNGWTDYFTKETSNNYMDLRHNEDIADSDNDLSDYGVWWQRDYSLELLQDLKETPNDPFFLYLSFQASHTPNEAPDDYTQFYEDYHCNDDGDDTDDETNDDTDDDDTRTQRISSMAQTSTLDDALSDIVSYLKNNGMWDNTLLVFSSDNGGTKDRGDNYPLRGFKFTAWEGGIRVPAFVSGGFLNEERRGARLDDVMVHITDWYPTLLSAANVDISYAKSTKRLDGEVDNRFNLWDPEWQVGGGGKGTCCDDDNDGKSLEIPLDGKDIWKYIQNAYDGTEAEDDDVGVESRELLLDLVYTDCDFDSCGAVRKGKYKYLRGANDVVGISDLGVSGSLWGTQFYNTKTCGNAGMDGSVESVVCDGIASDEIYDDACATLENGCLFDILEDPCEYHNIVDMHSDVAVEMRELLDGYQENAMTEVIQTSKVMDDDDLVMENGFWTPYQMYDDVIFEEHLFEKYKKMYLIGYDGDSGEKSDDDDDSEVFPIWNILLVFAFVVSCFLCLSFRIYQTNVGIMRNKVGVSDEYSPLLKV